MSKSGRAGGLKIAVSAEGPELDAKAGERLGLAKYLLVVDLESKDFEALRNPRDSGKGAGLQVVALLIAKKCNAVLTGWCSPTAERYLSSHGVTVVTGMSGTVKEILAKFERENLKAKERMPDDLESLAWKMDRRAAMRALQSASHQIKNLLPVMISVIFLAGLFKAFLSEKFLTFFFFGNMWRDSIWGAFIGSVFAGNPINSYIIGRQLLELGVSLVAVTAFICSWVTVGLVQFPAESAALGWKFAVVRNLSCFGLSMAISFVMMFILGLFGM
jgi:predicted Fe-Mo cluster-binding NifX family protein